MSFLQRDKPVTKCTAGTTAVSGGKSVEATLFSFPMELLHRSRCESGLPDSRIEMPSSFIHVLGMRQGLGAHGVGHRNPIRALWSMDGSRGNHKSNADGLLPSICILFGMWHIEHREMRRVCSAVIGITVPPLHAKKLVNVGSIVVGSSPLLLCNCSNQFLITWRQIATIHMKRVGGSKLEPCRVWKGREKKRSLFPDSFPWDLFNKTGNS